MMQPNGQVCVKQLIESSLPCEHDGAWPPYHINSVIHACADLLLTYLHNVFCIVCFYAALRNWKWWQLMATWHTEIPLARIRPSLWIFSTFSLTVGALRLTAFVSVMYADKRNNARTITKLNKMHESLKQVRSCWSCRVHYHWREKERDIESAL